MLQSLVLDDTFSRKREIKTRQYILQFHYLNEPDYFVVNVYDLNRNAVLINQPIMTTTRLPNFRFTNINGNGGIANTQNIRNWVLEFDYDNQ